MRKIGFVIPWYGEKIPGGAENAFRDITTKLYEDGVDLEIVTTCVEKFGSDWSVNFHKPGLTENSIGIPVRRFAADKRDTEAFDKINYKICQGEPITRAEEEVFMQEMVNSQAMYDYLRERENDYELFVGIPYMFGPVYQVARMFPKKTLLIPCFHDEGYAHMEVFKECYSQIGGMFFNAQPEADLAERLYDLDNVIKCTAGLGMDVDISGDGAAFREKFQIEEPFILYAGRKDKLKNIDTLIRFFCQYKRRNPDSLKLVLIGGGEVEIPRGFESEIRDLGFVDIQDKYDAYAAAELLCQPSHNESFSYVIMESWLMGRPVLVHEDCAVTKNFALQAKGGLYFKTYGDFEGCVNYFRMNEGKAAQMGQNGRTFVLENFRWSTVLGKYHQVFAQVIENRQLHIKFQ